MTMARSLLSSSSSFNIRQASLLYSPATIRRSRTSPLLLRRQFHASPRHQFILAAITHSHDALQSLHTLTTLPWSLTLPLFALLLRTTLILPLSICQRKASQRQVALQPLLQAWRYNLQKETMKEYGHLGPLVAEKALLRKMRKKRGEIYKRWGCEMWKNFLGLLQLPIFLALMEAIRKMTGANQGVFGMLIGAGDVEDAEGVITSDGLMGEALRIPLDTSLATEGMLWFPNLLVPDPQLVLPFMLSGVILLNVYGGQGRGQDIALPKWQIRLKRGIGLAALCIGPLMIHVPSSLLVYWISSTSLAFLQAVVLERVMPIKPPPKPCVPKRPWRTGLGRIPGGGNGVGP